LGAFVDRGIIEKIEYINEKYPDVRVDIYTNASLLDRKMSDKLLETKLYRITFSVNGTGKKL